MVNIYRNLPAKSSEEAEKHRRQYEQMVEEAKKKGWLLPSVFTAVLVCSL